MFDSLTSDVGVEIVMMKIFMKSLIEFISSSIFSKINVFWFYRPPQSLHSNMSIHLPFPFILILISLDLRIETNVFKVYWEPWSVLKVSGFPNGRASSNASTQKDESIELEICHPTTKREKISLTATKVCNIRTPDLIHSFYDSIFQQIRINRITLCSNRCSFSGINRNNTHLLQEPLNPFSVDFISKPFPHSSHLTRPIIGLV